MAESILTSTKKILGIDENYTVFDLDIIIHINSVFSKLEQLGLGPVNGYMISDKTATWDAFTSDLRLNMVKSYMYLSVRLLFDPPQTSYLIEALRKQVEEMEWRMNVTREATAWTDPNPPVVPETP